MEVQIFEFEMLCLLQDGKILNDNSESNDSCVTSSTGPPPPPLAPLSGANVRKPTIKVDMDDSDSTGNNSLASFKDTSSVTGKLQLIFLVMFDLIHFTQ